MTSFKRILFIFILLLSRILLSPTHFVALAYNNEIIKLDNNNNTMNQDGPSPCDYSYLKLNTDINFFDNVFLYADSVAQRRLSSYHNLNYLSINYDGVPIYSDFDGNYNLNFFHPKFFQSIFENQQKFSMLPDISTDLNDTLSTVIQLFSGIKNSKFDINHFGTKNHFFWNINPVFESSTGYFYSNKNTKNPFDLIRVKNSGYQNISAYANAGYKNEKAGISIEGYFSNADLFVPNKLNENNITIHFNDYNLFIGKLNFFDDFSSYFIISGNVFYKYGYRNQLMHYDSAEISIDNTTLQISEYLYGANILVEFPTFFEYNTKMSLYYSQGVIIDFDLKMQYNLRLEDENLILTLYQDIYKSNKIKSNIEFQYFQNNINQSELGEIPSNKHGWNLYFNNQYNFSEFDAISLNLNKFSNVPFNSQYFSIYPKQIANPNLKIDDNYIIDLFYNRKISSYFTGNIGLTISKNDNLICNVPIAVDTFQFQNTNSIANMGVKSQMKYNNHNFSIYGNIEYVFSKFNNNIQKIQPNIIYPKFNFKLNSEYKFDFGLNARLNFVYMTGVNSYNSQSKEIETTKDVFLTNLYFEQLFDKNRIYIIINNLTNEIYYNYFNLPNSGVNFLMGVLLTF
jgi:hypothetical protein